MATKRSSKRSVQTVFEPCRPNWTLAFILMVSLMIMKLIVDVQDLLYYQRVYSFQHALLSVWTLHSNGRFYSEIIKSPEDSIRKAAKEVVGQKYADAMLVEVIEEPEGILVTFPSPKEVKECFYAFIIPVAGGSRYLLLEKTEDDFNLGFLSFLCEWTADGMHLNYGGKTYTNKTRFLADITDLISEP